MLRTPAMRAGVHPWVYCACLAFFTFTARAALAGEDTPGDKPKPRIPADESEAQLSDIGRPCDENFFNPCPSPLVCVDLRCAAKTSTRTAGRPKVDRDGRPTIESVRPFRLGVQNAFLIGFGGAIKNPVPAYTFLADFGFPTGRRARWHVELGYEQLNGYTGFRINPFVLGYTIPIIRAPVQLEVEVLAAILQSEIVFNDGYSIALSSGLRGQIVAVYGVGFAAFSPIGFEIRYAYGVQDVGIDTGVGANWPFNFTIGLEL